MGDRQNPIKFGPEWLRNLPLERNATSNISNSQSSGLGVTSASSTAGAAGASGTASNPEPGSSRESQPSTHNTNKVHISKLRYGREEMLAFFDKCAEAPADLKNIDILYQTRSQSPTSFNVTFEERETARSSQPTGNMSTGEKFGAARGSAGRSYTERSYMSYGSSVEGRARTRESFTRQTSADRPLRHTDAPRTPIYNTSTNEEHAPFSRPWNNSNINPTTSASRKSEQTERHLTKSYRNKRQGGRPNWRQMPRDDREEWRSVSGRSRSQDKWNKNWGDRPTADKSQSWNPNRRIWVRRETANTEDNLPEWAVDNAAACSGGTFDSSGAFHGYSNDDSNLPKVQDAAYPLARSHTHGSFVRQKTVVEGSTEWWASEKANKLSPKRFDAGNIKFQKTQPEGTSEGGTNAVNKSTVNKYDARDEVPTKESVVNYDEPFQTNTGGSDKNTPTSKFVESKMFDSHMRSDINIEEANDDRGNFQSVMITPNNSLRQKHQNIGLPINKGANNLDRKPGILRLPRAPNNSSAQSTVENQNVLTEDKIIEDMFDLTLKEKTPRTTVSPLLNAAGSSTMSGALTGMPQPKHQLPTPIQMGLQNREGLSLQPVMQPTGMQPSGMQPTGMQPTGMQPTGMQPTGMQPTGIQPTGMQPTVMQPTGMQPTGMQPTGMQPTGMQSNMVGIINSTLNASLGLPLDRNLGVLQDVPPPVLQNPRIGNSGISNINMGNSLQGSLGASALHSGTTGLPGYPSSLSQMSASDVSNNSLFLGQNSNNSSQLQGNNEFQLPNNTHQNIAWSVHDLQHSAPQPSFENSLYSNIMPQNPIQAPFTGYTLAEQWYYEDPKQTIQGPFTSQEMYNWYQAGFFTSCLMVRRACDPVMKPLGSYGPIVPFAPRGIMPYQLPVDKNLNNLQTGLGLDVIRIPNMNILNSNPVDIIHFGSVDIMRHPINNQNLVVETLWNQPTSSNDPMWMQHPINPDNENRVNNLSLFFWDQQPSAMVSNSMLPEGIHKEMKTEDQILAQLRASQNIATFQTSPFMTDQQLNEASVANKSNDNFSTLSTATPKMEELQKLIQKETLVSIPPPPNEPVEVSEEVTEKTITPEPNITEVIVSKPVAATKSADSKIPKQTKNEGDKITKKNEKIKNEKAKKLKEEKKEEVTEVKVKEKEKEETDSEKRSAENSPSKSKKEEKAIKKDLEKEKKELIKDGFTIVKGSEKNVNKENKKKAEELKAAEELDRKKKEEEKLAVVEEKKKKQLDTQKKQQEQQQQKQISELVMKKAPWSVISNQVLPATNKDGLTLTEIQRLEREKKLEQIKEQQHMMQIIAQQQAAALARDQEMQAGLGWAKKKPSNNMATGQTLVEIQAEARKQAVAAATVVQTLDEPQTPVSTPNNHIPWGNTHNGGGFWDTQPSQIPKPEPSMDSPKIPEINKSKKKPNLMTTTKKEASPAAEFENWCSVELASWSSKIDVPTFVGFLKDIESPYEVKDYVKCYLGESKDSSDFARQFLERRSKLLRVGMVTPSDDLCSPAIAVNPRTVSGSDYQEVKNKGKKIKKNKMLKVDSRILGFSVTAAEDRINVGDIDTV